MSKSQSNSPYRRDNYFGKTEEDERRQTGHVETEGTDAAMYLAYDHLSNFAELVCGRTLESSGREQPLSEPLMHLPKQHETDHGYIEYRQHRHRRRVNPETGWINWGESTSTAVPEVDKDVFMLAVSSYLRENGVQPGTTERWTAYARRQYHDPQLSSQEALAKLVARKREYDSNRQNAHETAELPDA